ncbi:hypothetical protein ccbrp13_56270 [Ktedonobacteria bacterium brp13]|nr:hypothetical protein ccbrp13_56270 [Ktedonobacteria bacterium brp13]
MLQRVRLVQPHPQITSPIRLAAIKREMQQREAFADRPTTRMQATTGSMKRLPRPTRKMLALDHQGRMISMVADSFLDTMALIEEQIQRYISVENHYPSEILLSPLRYLASFSQITHYRFPHFDLSIPIVFDRHAYESYRFDVMVRGK